jgi:hypothetical protein
VSLIVVHAISLPPGSSVVRGSCVCSPIDSTLRLIPTSRRSAGLRVSAHFLLRRDGELIQFVSCRQRAWHAGLSMLAGAPRCNDFSLGIELEGCDELPFDDGAVRACCALLRALCAPTRSKRWSATATSRPVARPTRALVSTGVAGVDRRFPAAADGAGAHEEAVFNRGSAEKAANSVDRFSQSFDAGGVGKAQDFLGLVAAEVEAGRAATPADSSRSRAKRSLSSVSRCNRRRRRKRLPAWPVRRKPRFFERRRQEVAPALELLAPFLEDAEGGRRECGQRRVLGRRRWRNEEILRQLLDVACETFGDDQPAQSPAGHVEVLGKALHDEDVIAELQAPLRVTLVGQAVVDLVDDQLPLSGGRSRRSRPALRHRAGCRSGWPAKRAGHRPCVRSSALPSRPAWAGSCSRRDRNADRSTPSKLRTKWRLHG